MSYRTNVLGTSWLIGAISLRSMVGVESTVVTPVNFDFIFNGDIEAQASKSNGSRNY